jgi:hypothetical protein
MIIVVRYSVLITTRPWPGCDFVIERTALTWIGLERI